MIVGGALLMLFAGVHLFARGIGPSASKTISIAEENLGRFIAENGKNESELKTSVASLQRLGFFRVRAHILASLAYNTSRQTANCDPTTGDAGDRASCWIRRGCMKNAESIYALTVHGRNRKYVAELLERIRKKYDIECRWVITRNTDEFDKF